MNLLNCPRSEKISDYEFGKILFKDFRKFQYEIIPYFLRCTIEYISSLNNNFLTIKDIIINDKYTYYGLNHNELQSYEVIIYNNLTKIEKPFVKFFMPKLIDDYYFILNENYYVPTVYILDKPIIVKSGSIKLYGLINSITIYLKKDVCIFIRNNIPLSYFLQLFLNDTEYEHLYDDIVTEFKLAKIVHTDNEIINYFSQIFNIGFTNKNQIKLFIEKLFFDEYTKNLYTVSYNTTSLYDIIVKSINSLLLDKNPSFIDLSNKRLVFMELLLTPYFKKITALTTTCINNYNVDQIKFDLGENIKFFTRTKNKSGKQSLKSDGGLDGNYIYDIANLYGGLLSHKCCFVNPGSTNPPSEISGIHESHFKKLCPITIADLDPGHTVSIIPDTTVDWFGNFVST